jgi:hypothetical protein
MPKIGRNDPCPCGSGKKYKHCHQPIDEAAQAAKRRLRNAFDTLLPQLIGAAQGRTEAIPTALERFWNGKYTAEQLSELDDLEDRGADRFLTWFAFDYPQEDGRTLVEQLAADPGDEVTLNEEEATLIKEWASVRLRPYVVESVEKGLRITLRDLLDSSLRTVEDHAASKRVKVGEVLVTHILPAGDVNFIGGAAAHLTDDTSEKLREFSELHLEAFRRDHPDADWTTLLRARSEVLNHFVMALPVEEADPTVLENIIAQTRASLQLTGESLGLIKSSEEEPKKDEESAS